MSEEKSERLVAPYLPFKTFINVLDSLKSHGMPHKIDRSVFPSQSGVVQGQIMGALRFFDLIDEHGTPKGVALEHLATDESKRKENLKAVLMFRYGDIVKQDLTKLSPSHLDSEFDRYGVTGDTKKKAKTFFIKAAQYVGMPLSPLLTRKTRSSGGTRKRRATHAPQNTQQENRGGYRPPKYEDSLTSRTVKLHCGGELALSVNVNLFDLVGEDREFVFGLIDKLQAYVGEVNKNTS